MREREREREGDRLKEIEKERKREITRFLRVINKSLQCHLKLEIINGSLSLVNF